MSFYDRHIASLTANPRQLRYDFKPIIIQLYQVTVDGEHNVQPDTVL